MKIRQLEYFCAVAEEKSISAAARELHVAQPPISRQIAQLEEELGVQLFLRGSKGMSLTDAGQSLYQQTQQIFQDIRRVEDSVRSVGTGMSGRIKLGVIYSAMSYALHYINEYHSRYPQVELFIRVGSPQELIESLNRGLIFLSHLLLDEALHTRGAEHRAVPCQNGIRADRQTAHRLCL